LFYPLSLHDALPISSNVLPIAPAGNDGTSQPQYPAAFAGVMTAAATDLSDIKGLFSNYGSYVFAAAPGVGIISAYPGGYYGVVSDRKSTRLNSSHVE